MGKCAPANILEATPKAYVRRKTSTDDIEWLKVTVGCAANENFCLSTLFKPVHPSVLQLSERNHISCFINIQKHSNKLKSLACKANMECSLPRHQAAAHESLLGIGQRLNRSSWRLRDCSGINDTRGKFLA